MSMMARFVQIDPSRLQKLVAAPSGVEELFQAEGPHPVAQAALARAVTPERLRAAPQLLEAVLARMDPGLRQAMEKRFEVLGVSAKSVRNGDGAEKLIQLMAERTRASLAAGSGRAPQLTASSPGRGAAISLDKAWHGVHYLLCGAAVPGTTSLSQPVMGGTELGDDQGYGPARYFTAEQVGKLAIDLRQPALEPTVMARFELDEMTRLGIYPGVWSPDDRDWLLTEFRRLRDFYLDADSRGLAIVTCLV